MTRGQSRLANKTTSDKMQFKPTRDKENNWLGGTTEVEHLNALTTAGQHDPIVNNVGVRNVVRLSFELATRQATRGLMENEKKMKMGEVVRLGFELATRQATRRLMENEKKMRMGEYLPYASQDFR
ncbi:unnamed protein product [Citrullus colocynthis]|uniref:Uncharacterized protein n=1 Tax=Citrullus colocynthis TaxID=252529 RepID=A0ABP0Z3T4_9ROSI